LLEKSLFSNDNFVDENQYLYPVAIFLEVREVIVVGFLVCVRKFLKVSKN